MTDETTGARDSTLGPRVPGTESRAPRLSSSSSMKPSADFGGVSRPSSHAWIATGSPARRPSSMPQRRCQVGVAPSSIALPSRPGRKPQPSSTINTTGVRAARVLFILKGMQVSQVLRALPVVLGLAQRLSAQADVRVQTEGEWFFQEPDGKRLAQVPRGVVVGGGAARGDWQQVTLEGWIFGGSVGPTVRPGFHLAVTRAPDENLRAVPLGTGALVARLNRGFALNRIGDSGRWVHVRREGWMKRDALEPVAAAASSASASRSDTAQGWSIPGPRPGADTTPAGPPPPDPPARRLRAAPRCP